MEPTSEITRLRESIRLEYEAAQRALHSLASGTAKHEFISKRMGNMQKSHEQLKTIVGEQEATRLVVETIEAVQNVSVKQSEARQ